MITTPDIDTAVIEGIFFKLYYCFPMLFCAVGFVVGVVGFVYTGDAVYI